MLQGEGMAEFVGKRGRRVGREGDEDDWRRLTLVGPTMQAAPWAKRILGVPSKPVHVVYVYGVGLIEARALQVPARR